MNTFNDLQRAMDDMQDITRKKNNPAGYMLDRLKVSLQIFEKTMADDAEVGMNVVGGGSGGTFHLRTIAVSNPDILIFDGVDDIGRKVQLLQHYSQMSVMFIEVPKLEEKPHRIGFL
jgi:hypothetical protein